MLLLTQSSKPGFYRSVETTELKLNQKHILNFTAISLFMMVTSLTGTSTMPVTDIPKVNNIVVDAKAPKSDISRTQSTMSTEQYVRNYFRDIPIMIQIARCESTFRHLDDNGEIHRGKVNKSDVGVMQINEYYHLDQAEKKDINIYSIEGNVAYARDLYEREGTQPWSSSKPCWGKYENDVLAFNTK